MYNFKLIFNFCSSELKGIQINHYSSIIYSIFENFVVNLTKSFFRFSINVFYPDFTDV